MIPEKLPENLHFERMPIALPHLKIYTGLLEAYRMLSRMHQHFYLALARAPGLTHSDTVHIQSKQLGDLV